MKGFQSPFQIGSLRLRSNVFCSPLAGCSDMPFRTIMNRYRPGLYFCEMVKMDAIVRYDPTTFRILDYQKDMHPIGAQIVGSKVELSADSARIVEDMGFDLIDLNCGCPVDNVTKDGSGSGLLKEPEKIGEIIYQMVNAVSCPVTVKIRSGWNDSTINGPMITEIAEQAGAKAIFVHGRTRSQGYKGPAIWSRIQDCKKVAKEMPVFGNGDAFTVSKVEQMFHETGCDGVLISRGSFGQPWIFEDVERKAHGLPAIKRDGFTLRDVLLDHLQEIIAYRCEKKAVQDLRRVGCWFFKLANGTKKLRELLNKSKSLVEIQQVLNAFPWEEISIIDQEQETALV